MSYPRKWGTGPGETSLVDEYDWNGLLDHSLEKTASYIVRVNGSVYEAINGSTGKIDYSGTDASTVIQSAANAIKSAGGGKIFISKSVNVTWDAGVGTDHPFLYIDFSNFEIEGEDGHQITLLNQATGIKAVGTSSNPIKNIIIRNMNFVGDPSNDENHGLDFNYVVNGLIEGCAFTNFGDEAISVGLGSRNVVVRNNWLTTSNNVNVGAPITLQSGGHLVEGNFITLNAPTAGIHLEAITGTEEISKVVLRNNVVYGQNIGNYGIMLNRSAFNITDVLIEGNEVYDVLYDGISDFNLAGGTMKAIRVTVAGNIVKGGGTNTNARGAIRFDKNSPEKLIIVSNIVNNYGLTNSDGHGIVVCSHGAIIANNKVDGVGCNGLRLANDGLIVIGNTIENSQQTYGLGAIYLGGSYCCIIGNSLGDGYRGIYTAGTATGSVIIGNKFGTHTKPFDNNSSGIFRFEDNINYVTENGGTVTFSGNGSTTTFTIAHGLASTPTKVLVTAGSNAAKGDFYVTADATNITVTYGTAPPSGTNNVVLNWYAEV